MGQQTQTGFEQQLDAIEIGMVTQFMANLMSLLKTCHCKSDVRGYMPF